MALEEAQDLHLLRKLGQEFLVPFEMMNLGGIPASERAHGLDAFPIGDRHEFGFVPAIRAERLDTERLIEERLDAGFVVVGFVLVGAVARVRPRQMRTMVGCLRVETFMTRSSSVEQIPAAHLSL